MRHLRLLIIAVATICVLAFGAFAFFNRPTPQVPADDDIIIKGGSLEVDCGKNHGKDCFGDSSPGKVKPKHQDANKHITKIVVKDSNGVKMFDSSVFPTFGNKPEIDITYK